MSSSPPDQKKDGDKKSFTGTGGVAHDLGLTNPLLYLGELATVSGDLAGNTPKPTDIDGLFITGMKHLNMSQWDKAAVVFQDALEKAAKACKVKKPAKPDVEKLATACMCRGFIAACQSNLKLAFSLYKKSVAYWEALHGKDSEKLKLLKADFEKIKSRGVPKGSKTDTHEEHSDSHTESSETPEPTSPTSESSSSSSSESSTTS
jgi:hypothetical protein